MSIWNHLVVEREIRRSNRPRNVRPASDCSEYHGLTLTNISKAYRMLINVPLEHTSKNLEE